MHHALMYNGIEVMHCVSNATTVYFWLSATERRFTSAIVPSLRYDGLYRGLSHPWTDHDDDNRLYAAATKPDLVLCRALSALRIC